MTTLAAALGISVLLSLLAIAVIGALGISVLLSLVATPTIYFILRRNTQSQSSQGRKQLGSVSTSPCVWPSVASR